jgi:hypothetical protein
MKKAKVAGTTLITLVTGLLLTLCLAAAESDGEQGDNEQVVRVRSIVNTNSAYGTGSSAITGKSQLINANGTLRYLHPLGMNSLLFTQDAANPNPTPALPILAPDGHQVTLREWVRGFGEVKISCREKGTKYKMRFEDLIPNGVYTVFSFSDMGTGRLATHPSGEDNSTFQASDDGEGVLSVVATPGPMTLTGVMPQCSLTDLQREFFVVLYHIDGRPGCGPSPTCGGGSELPHMYFAVK